MVTGSAQRELLGESGEFAFNPLKGASFFHPRKPLRARLTSIDTVLLTDQQRYDPQDLASPLVSIKKMSPIALRNLHGARPMLISHTPHEACPLPEIAEPSPLTLGGSFFSPQRSTRIS